MTGEQAPRDFGFGEDEQLIRDAARKLFQRALPPGAVRARRAVDHTAPAKGATLAYDDALWSEIVAAGLPGTLLPSSVGGTGARAVAGVALAETLGRFAVPSALGSTLSATALLRALLAREPEGSALQLAARVVEGARATILGAGPNDAMPGFDAIVANGTSLTGAAFFVPDAPCADVFVVLAHDARGPALFSVDRSAQGVHVVEDRIVDLTRRQGHVQLDGAEGVRLTETAAAAAWSEARCWLWTLAAADANGACEWLLQTTVDYAKVREQFGHPIGAYQAVKHPLVAMMSSIDLSRSLAYDAAALLDHAPSSAEIAARMAKAQACDAARFAAGRAVQLHGGIGFTWECDVHLWMKRAIHGQLTFGDAGHHKKALAALLFDQPSRKLPSDVAASSGRFSP